MKPIYSNFTVMRGRTRTVPHSWIEHQDLIIATIFNPEGLSISAEPVSGIGVKFTLSEKPAKRTKVHYQILRPSQTDP